jgi:hypothetical protein
MASLFSGFNGSSYLRTAQQYMRGRAISTAFMGEKSDLSAPPPRVSNSTLAAEVQKEFGTSLDPVGIYFVYTSNFRDGGSFCAWHCFAAATGHNVAVAYMPNTTGVAGCDGGNGFGDPSHSEGLYSLANVTAHEFMEAVTDTWPGSRSYAWIDTSSSEIGDKCAWQFSGPVTLSNSAITWQLQQAWSNKSSGCVEGQ